MERHGPSSGGQLTLAATVAEAARRFDDRPAVVAPRGWPLTYRQLDRCSEELAAGLRRRGIGPGDVVALVTESSPDFLVAYAAAAKVGAVTAGINPRAAAEQRRAMLQIAMPALVIATADLAAGADDWPVETIQLAGGPDELLTTLRRPGEPTAPPIPDANRPIAIVFTSGTAGQPKAAVFSGRHIDAIRRIDVGDAWGGGGPLLISTELVHVGVMTKLAWYLRTGSTLHLLRRWRARDALEVISRRRIPSVGAIAPQVALMLRDPDFDRFDLQHVTTIVAGGAPSSPALVTEARRRFGAAYSIRYSSTESGGVGTATAFDAADEEALHTVGRPRPGVDVEIRNEDRQPLPSGEVGTVWLRSPAVMAGYWRDPESSATTLVDGWLRTGDLGRIDGLGCLRLEGRADDTYVRGGYNVHPAVVAAVLAGHPDVTDVAVVAGPHEVLGQVGIAVVVPRDPSQPPTLHALRDFGARHLAHHELPEDLVVVADLPRTSLHKLDRGALQRLTAMADGRSVRSP